MADWSSLPLLSLRCILNHLSLEDALATLSVCRHWRSAVLLYEGHKDTLKISVEQWEKSLFLTRIFKKYAKNLHIYLDGSEQEIEKFMTYLLPQFFDTVKLQEVLFIGPSYMQKKCTNIVKIKRLILESLVHKNVNCLEKLALIGCDVDAVNESDRYINKHIEHYSRTLMFNYEPTVTDSLHPWISLREMQYSMLNHLILDYPQLRSSLCTLVSRLPRLRAVTACVRGAGGMGEGGGGDWEDIDWTPLNGRGIGVSVVMINVPYNMFYDVIDTILVEDLPLTSFKVLYCKTLHLSIVRHVAQMYRTTLQEFVWADCPRDSECSHDRYTPEEECDFEYGDTYDVNPFILLCWQCTNLRRLAIHGYWIWQYDILGFIRLRNSLELLEISAVYSRNGRFKAKQTDFDILARVLICDTPRELDLAYIQELDQYSELPWRPLLWRSLPPGLKARAAPRDRAQVIVDEVGGAIFKI